MSHGSLTRVFAGNSGVNRNSAFYGKESKIIRISDNAFSKYCKIVQ